MNGGILFDKKSGKGPITARVYRKPGPPAGIKVIGSIVEDVTVSSGIKLELLDHDEITYWFVLDGKSLSGTDSAGTRYTFTLKP